MRMLPPESLPRPSGEPPAAMIAASPLLLAPGERAMSYGLRVPPCSEFQLSPPTPPGGQSVFPIKIAPAARIRATTVASRSGMLLRSMRSPAVVGSPAVSKMSLAVKGTPCKGPTSAFRLLFLRSAARACLRALSPVAKTTALSRGFTVWMCSRCARTTSSEETCLVGMARAAQAAGAPMMSLIYGWITLDLVPRVDIEHFYARSDQVPQVLGTAGERREGAEVHRHHRGDAEQRHRLGGALGTHRVEAADRQESHV